VETANFFKERTTLFFMIGPSPKPEMRVLFAGPDNSFNRTYAPIVRGNEDLPFTPNVARTMSFTEALVYHRRHSVDLAVVDEDVRVGSGRPQTRRELNVALSNAAEFLDVTQREFLEYLLIDKNLSNGLALMAVLRKQGTHIFPTIDMAKKYPNLQIENAPLPGQIAEALCGDAPMIRVLGAPYRPTVHQAVLSGLTRAYERKVLGKP
jgi:hypothetical protein